MLMQLILNIKVGLVLIGNMRQDLH